MTDFDLTRIVCMAATEKEYDEYARHIAAAGNAARKAAKSAAMLMAKYSPELIGWGDDFCKKPLDVRMRAAGRSAELIERIMQTSSQLMKFGMCKKNVAWLAKDDSAKKD